MADMDEGMLAEFAEFLEAKRAASAPTEPEDEVEIWNEKGQGARVRRSVAKPFLQSLGIDLDPPAGDTDNTGTQSDNDGTKGKKSTGRQATAPATGSVARKYFVKK
jgi:hypothetical protein